MYYNYVTQTVGGLDSPTQATVSVQQVTANQKGSVELSALLLLSPRKNSDLHYCLTLI